MQLDLEHDPNIQLIESYSPEAITINGQAYTQPLIVTADAVICPWVIDDYTDIYTLSPDILILGTGEKLIIPEPKLIAEIQSKGIGFEFMDTGGACRTYNVLASEGRKVAAALLLS